MATRLFFHNVANALPGTFPTAEQSTVGTPTKSVSGADTLMTMGSLTGTSMVTRSISGSSTVAQQILMCGMFASLPLDVAQQIPPQPVTLNIANRESSTTMNLGADLRAVAYAWRPGTGTLVGYIVDGLTMVGDAEPSTALSIRVNNASVTSTVTVSTAAGDVIICEIWQVFTQGAANAFTGAIYFDGTTQNSTTNATVSDHASFFELTTSSLTFSQPIVGAGSISCAVSTVAATGSVAIRGAGSISCAASTVAATGRVALAGAGSISCAAATLAGTGRVAISGAFSATLADATVAGTGTLAGPFTFGNRSVTLADATVAATGKVAVAGAGSISCADVTLAATGVVVDPNAAITGTRNVTLERAVVTATGTLGAEPPVPAPALPRGNSGGSGASRTRKRKMFRIPDLAVEPEKTLDDMLGVRKEPAPTVVRVEEPIRSARPRLLTEAVAASPPAIALTLPKPSPVVVEEEEYSDEDLIQLLLMVSP